MISSKQYNVLLIEDQKHHMNDARRIGNELAWCKIDYIRTYEEFMQRTQMQHYDGIVCDVFFPAHDRQDTQYMNTPKGWSYNLALSLERILQPHFEKYIREIPLDKYDFETRKEIEDETNAYQDALSWRPQINSR